jgi:FkbM family methyltransferase
MPKTDYIVSYAQNREDAILRGFFTGVKQGFYVDVGANHPRIDSVTKIFYDEGWSGINIEPNPNLYALLKRDRPRDINLQIGISDKPGKLTLREYPNADGLSTFSADVQHQYEKDPNSITKKTLDYEVPVKPLSDVFAENRVQTINFMKVDVEGYEYQVLAGNDWSSYRPQILCIEANHIIKDWRPLLKQHKYELVFFDGLNEYYVAAEHKALANKFSYPEALLARPPIPAKFIEGAKMTEWQMEQTERKLIQQEIINESLRGEIHQIYLQQVQRQRIRTLVKQLLVAIDKAVLTQINKLDKPHVVRQEPIDLPASYTAEEMLAAVRVYDFDLYSSLKTGKPLSYRLAAGLHDGLYRGCRLFLRKAANLARRRNRG